MQHPDEDQLIALALGIETPDAALTTHVDACDQCQAELSDLRRVAAAGRSAPHPDELIEPPQRVWEGIRTTLEAGSAPSRQETLSAPAEPATERAADVQPIASRRRARRTRWLAVAAGFVVGAVAAGTMVALVDDSDSDGPDQGQLVADTPLEPLSSTGTAGSAAVLDVDGQQVLDVSVDSRTPGGGYREVWLLDEKAERLVSLGVLSGTESRFVIPAGLDLAEYPIVDVSREPLDGDPAHSSDSIARGQLPI
jgi:hypothetical protein